MIAIYKKYKKNLFFLLIGIFSLLIGAFVYYTDRPPDKTYFVNKFTPDLNIHGKLPGLFGAIGKSLPDFMHVFAFIFLSVSVSSLKKNNIRIICVTWLIIDVAFELGQKYLKKSIRDMPDWFDGIPVLEAIKSYFISGTFDYGDLFSIFLGTALAYVMIMMIINNDK